MTFWNSKDGIYKRVGQNLNVFVHIMQLAYNNEKNYDNLNPHYYSDLVKFVIRTLCYILTSQQINFFTVSNHVSKYIETLNKCVFYMK